MTTPNGNEYLNFLAESRVDAHLASLQILNKSGGRWRNAVFTNQCYEMAGHPDIRRYAVRVSVASAESQAGLVAGSL